MDAKIHQNPSKVSLDPTLGTPRRPDVPPKATKPLSNRPYRDYSTTRFSMQKRSPKVPQTDEQIAIHCHIKHAVVCMLAGSSNAASKQVSKPANQPASKQANKQASKPASQQASKLASQQASKPESQQPAS